MESLPSSGDKDKKTSRRQKHRASEPTISNNTYRKNSGKKSTHLDEKLDAKISLSAPTPKTKIQRRNSSPWNLRPDDISVGSHGLSVYSSHSTGVFSRRSSDNIYLQALGLNSSDDGFSSESYSSDEFDDLVSVMSERSGKNSGKKPLVSSKNLPEENNNLKTSSKFPRQLLKTSSFGETARKKRPSNRTTDSRMAYSESVLKDKVIRPNIEMSSAVNFFPGVRRTLKKGDSPKTQSTLGRKAFLKWMEEEDNQQRKNSRNLQKSLGIKYDSQERTPKCTLRRFLLIILAMSFVTIICCILLSFFFPHTSTSEPVKKMTMSLRHRLSTENDFTSIY